MVRLQTSYFESIWHRIVLGLRNWWILDPAIIMIYNVEVLIKHEDGIQIYYPTRDFVSILLILC